MDYFLLTTLSFIVGIIVGLTGIGGASLITPMLILVFQVPPSLAISSDVVAATLMKVVGGLKHWRQQTIDLPTVKWLALGSVPGSLTGVGILHLWRQQGANNMESMLLHILALAVILVTSTALLQFFPWQKLGVQLPTLPTIDLETKLGRIMAIGLGAVLGCLVGLTSVSSGSLFALVLITFFRLDTRRLVGTDLAQAGILLTFASLGHLSLGTVSWHLVLPIWLGSLPGVWLGSQLCQFVPLRILKLGIYALLVMASWKLAHIA